MIPFEIRKLVNKDGKITYHLAVASENLIEDGIFDKVQEIEDIFHTFLIMTKEKMNQIKKSGNNNAILHWELGNMIYNFKQEVEKKGFIFLDELDTFARYNGEAKNKWKVCIRLRKAFPEKTMIGDDLSLWGRLITEKEHVIEKISEKIKNKQILTKEQLEKEISLLTGTSLQLRPAHEKILGALRKEDLSDREIAIKTGISYDGVRGRLSELRGRFGYKDKLIKVNEKYHLVNT